MRAVLLYSAGCLHPYSVPLADMLGNRRQGNEGLGKQAAEITKSTAAVRAHCSRGSASAITVKPVRRLPRNKRTNKRRMLIAFIAIGMGSSNPIREWDARVP
jgi:hypothetical protein